MNWFSWLVLGFCAAYLAALGYQLYREYRNNNGKGAGQ